MLKNNNQNSNHPHFSLVLKDQLVRKMLLPTNDKDEAKDYFLGQHLLAEFNVEPLSFTPAEFEKIIRDAAVASNATILTSRFFENSFSKGVSGIVVIEESHFSMHYLPSHQLIALDVYTCGKKINLEKAIQHITENINAKPYDEIEFKRGIRQVHNGKIVEGSFIPGIALLNSSTLSFLEIDMKMPVSQQKSNSLGQHYIAEFYSCNPDKIDNADFVLQTFKESLGLTNDDNHFGFAHQFTPQGVSAVVIGDGFHLTVHDWPEYAYAAIDLCIFDSDKKVIDPDEVIKYLALKFQSKKSAVNRFPRGAYQAFNNELKPVFNSFVPASTH